MELHCLAGAMDGGDLIASQSILRHRPTTAGVFRPASVSPASAQGWKQLAASQTRAVRLCFLPLKPSLPSTPPSAEYC